MVERRRGRVLVLLTGGNIGLVATPEVDGSELRSATTETIRNLVCERTDHTTVFLREGSGSGVAVSVEFEDLRVDEHNRLLDPEELDSAQVKPERWAKIARVIRDRYGDFDGFVVLHGLDTMAYTAAALSFMLGNLQKPVVFTGSQRPLNYRRTDAVQNILSAITMAAAEPIGVEPVVREVTVYSYDTLFRGSRSSMVNASSYRTFDSPNFPPLATVGEHIEIQSHLLRTPTAVISKALNVSLAVDAKVVILDVFPGMDESIISSIKDKGSIRGVVLRTYGMGTAPTAPSVLKALQELNEAGIVVMNVTQARSGRISYGQDPVSLRLFEQGVISGVDMTAEAALAKMVVFLSKAESFQEVFDALQVERCGEQSQSIFNIHFGKGETTYKKQSGECVAILEPIIPREHRDIVRRRESMVNYVQFRLLGVEPNDDRQHDRKRLIPMKISLIGEGGNQNLPEIKLDHLEWAHSGQTVNKAYDISSAKQYLLSQLDNRTTTNIQITTHDPIRWKRASIAIFMGTGERV